MKEYESSWLNRPVTKDRAKDSGMAVVLILLLSGLILKGNIYFSLAAMALLINMIFPMFYHPFAIVWFGLSGIMGRFMSKLLLSLVFMAIVMPVAMVRHWMGKDPLMLKRFGKSDKSVLKTRNHVFEAKDLEKPF